MLGSIHFILMYEFYSVSRFVFLTLNTENRVRTCLGFNLIGWLLKKMNKNGNRVHWQFLMDIFYTSYQFLAI